MEKEIFNNEPEIKDKDVERFLECCAADKYAKRVPYENPLFEIISPRTRMQILINREWKSSHCRYGHITDLEDLIYNETGNNARGYIELLCGNNAYDYSDFGKELKKTVKQMDHSPFPSKDIFIDQLREIIEKGSSSRSDEGKQ